MPETPRAIAPRRCQFEKCREPRTIETRWPAVHQIGWYCNEHAEMLVALDCVEVLARD